MAPKILEKCFVKSNKNTKLANTSVMLQIGLELWQLNIAYQ